MSEHIDWEKIRRDFPVTEKQAYLNSAASGPVTSAVVEAAAGFYRDMMLQGDAFWTNWWARRERARSLIARLINAEPDEIGFTINTSTGMNVIVDALEGRGEVISSELEFPVSTIPWIHRGIKVHMVKTPGGRVDIEEINRLMTDRTGVICLSHVQYSNGCRANLEQIGENKKAHAFVVNASQSAGVLEIDVKRMRIDALCTTGHKWLLSGYGSGFVYLSRELLDGSRARAVGWMSAENPFRMNNREFAVRGDASARVELGVPQFPSAFALETSLDYLSKIGIKSVEERALSVNRYLTTRLGEVGWRVLSPIEDEASRSAETLVAAEHPAPLVAHLTERGIRVTQKPEGFRVATHFFNNEADIEQLIAALGEAQN